MSLRDNMAPLWQVDETRYFQDPNYADRVGALVRKFLRHGLGSNAAIFQNPENPDEYALEASCYRDLDGRLLIPAQPINVSVPASVLEEIPE